MPKMLILNTKFSGSSSYLARHLKKRGWELIIVDIPSPKIYKFLAVVSTFRLNLSDWLKAAENRLGKINKSSFVFIQRTRFCKRVINKFKDQIDIIFQMQGLFMPSTNIEKLGIPYALFTDYTMKLAEEYTPWSASKSQLEKWYRLERALYKNSSLNFTITETARRSFINDYSIDENKVVTVGVSAPLDEIPDEVKSYDGRTILFIGKDFDRKGGWDLIEAFKKVKKVIIDARLIIVGPRKGVLKIKEPGVTVLGRINNRTEIIDLYKQSSIFVMPSICEPSGFVFLEAMAYRLPCIGTNVGGIPELIEEGKTGFLVSPNNPEILAEKIISLLKDPELMKKMGVNGHSCLKNKFSWDSIAEKIDSHLRDLI